MLLLEVPKNRINKPTNHPNMRDYREVSKLYLGGKVSRHAVRLVGLEPAVARNTQRGTSTKVTMVISGKHLYNRRIPQLTF